MKVLIDMKTQRLCFEEFYYECFKCPECENESLSKTDKYCSNCGSELIWIDEKLEENNKC